MAGITILTSGVDPPIGFAHGPPALVSQWFGYYQDQRLAGVVGLTGSFLEPQAPRVQELRLRQDESGNLTEPNTKSVAGDS